MIIRYVLSLLSAIVMAAGAHAHQFLPTYPKFQRSFVEGVMVTRMELFNKRSEIEFYELQVFDKDWNKVAFASESKIIKVKYLETKRVEFFVRSEDILKVQYICSESKIIKGSSQQAFVASKICSKVK